MTRDEAKQLLPIIQAYAEGKKIEYRIFEGGQPVWHDYDEHCFTSSPDRYRIKPEPIECWAVVKDGGVLYIRERQKDAKDVASACKDFRVIQLREVV